MLRKLITSVVTLLVISLIRINQKIILIISDRKTHMTTKYTLTNIKHTRPVAYIDFHKGGGGHAC